MTAYLFLFIGITSILLACIFIGIIKYSLFKGLGVSFIVIGFISIIKGFLLLNNPLLEVFHLNYWLFIIVFILSSVLFFYTHKRKLLFYKGFFLGNMIQLPVFLVLSLV